MERVLFPVIEIASSPSFSEVVAMNINDARQPIKRQSFERRKWQRVFITPLLWLITFYVAIKKAVFGKRGKRLAINCVFVDGWGKVSRAIKDGAASWKALDLLYNYKFGEPNSRTDNFWVGNMLNTQAIRNRFKLVKKEIRSALLKFKGEKEIRVISLACGSAQAMLETMFDLSREGVNVKIILVDQEQSALDYARKTAAWFGLSDQIETRCMSVAQISRIARDFKPHVIEMLGLLDYFKQETAINLAKRIKESLLDGGIFLTCNIAPNLEMKFLEIVMNWPMIYRKPSELYDVAYSAGFDASNIRLIYEPLKIHGILIAQK